MTAHGGYRNDDEWRAYRILDDRRSARFLVWDEGRLEIIVAVSEHEPGYAVISDTASEPHLLHEGQVAEMVQLLTGGKAFPDEPRPCDECQQREHADDCLMAEDDPTRTKRRLEGPLGIGLMGWDS